MDFFGQFVGNQLPSGVGKMNKMNKQLQSILFLETMSICIKLCVHSVCRRLCDHQVPLLSVFMTVQSDVCNGDVTLMDPKIILYFSSAVSAS